MTQQEKEEMINSIAEFIEMDFDISLKMAREITEKVAIAANYEGDIGDLVQDVVNTIIEDKCTINEAIKEIIH